MILGHRSGVNNLKNAQAPDLIGMTGEMYVPPGFKATFNISRQNQRPKERQRLCCRQNIVRKPQKRQYKLTYI